MLKLINNKLSEVAVSILFAVATVMALSEVFSIVAPGPFSPVLNTIQEIDSFVFYALITGGAGIGYAIIMKLKPNRTF